MADSIQHIIDNPLAAFYEYVEGTEVPKVFYRWAFLGSMGATLGRNIEFPFGHFTWYPNMYVILVGAPASRKSSAISIVQTLMQESGYSYFAAKKSSKQKFLMDWQEKAGSKSILDVMDKMQSGSKSVAENFICADEMLDFMGRGNFDLISMLTTLWDNLPDYEDKVKNSVSSYIHNPTLNILGGMTCTNLAMAFPSEVAGQGLLSRILCIYSEPTGRKVTFPKPPDENKKQALIEFYRRLRKFQGTMTFTKEGSAATDKIYKRWRNVFDIKLEHYAGRRLNYLCKLCMILAAARFTTEITFDIVQEANTYLLHAEQSMDKALMEFGTARNLESTNKVFSAIESSEKPIQVHQIWNLTSSYFERIGDLGGILNNLASAGKITHTEEGIVALKKELPDFGNLVDFDRYLKGENI